MFSRFLVAVKKLFQTAYQTAEVGVKSIDHYTY
jgi:hypothetical protein